MSKLGDFRREIRQKFLTTGHATAFGFYGQYDTHVLERVRIGFERDYDAGSQGEPYRQPLDWLSERIRIINRILEDREVERPRTVDEKIWARIEQGATRAPIRYKNPA